MMDDFGDNISELSSLASCPSSLAYSLWSLRENTNDISYTDLEDDQGRILPSHSPSLVLIPIPQPKRKRLTPRSWVWASPEEPLGLLVEVGGIKYENNLTLNECEGCQNTNII